MLFSISPIFFTSELLSCQLTAVHKCLCLSVRVCVFVCFIFHALFAQSTSWPASEPWPLHVQRNRTSLFVVCLCVDRRAWEAWDSSPLSLFSFMPAIEHSIIFLLMTVFFLFSVFLHSLLHAYRLMFFVSTCSILTSMQFLSNNA